MHQKANTSSGLDNRGPGDWPLWMQLHLAGSIPAFADFFGVLYCVGLIRCPTTVFEHHDAVLHSMLVLSVQFVLVVCMLYLEGISYTTFVL
jgi:hypothetical protein